MESLRAILDSAFALLEEGAAEPQSVWRNLALATVDAGAPSIRTLVLRRCLPAERVVEMHTDARSAKIGVIGRHVLAGLHGWDPARRVQLRLDGALGLGDEMQTQAAWDSLAQSSRSTYAVGLPPGTVVPDPATPPPPLAPPDARSVFRLLRFHIDGLDYLSLAHGRHRRARFTWSGRALEATWRVP